MIKAAMNRKFLMFDKMNLRWAIVKKEDYGGKFGFLFRLAKNNCIETS